MRGVLDSKARVESDFRLNGESKNRGERMERSSTKRARADSKEYQAGDESDKQLATGPRRIIVDRLGSHFSSSLSKIMEPGIAGVAFVGRPEEEFSWIAVHCSDEVFLFDIVSLGRGAYDKGLRDFFESPRVRKLVFDSRRPSLLLWSRQEILLVNVIDVIAFDAISQTSTCTTHSRLRRLSSLHEAVGVLLRLPSGATEDHQRRMALAEKDPQYWYKRERSDQAAYEDMLEGVSFQAVHLRELSTEMTERILRPVLDGSDFFLSCLRDARDSKTLAEHETDASRVPREFFDRSQLKLVGEECRDRTRKLLESRRSKRASEERRTEKTSRIGLRSRTTSSSPSSSSSSAVIEDRRVSLAARTNENLQERKESVERKEDEKHVLVSSRREGSGRSSSDQEEEKSRDSGGEVEEEDDNDDDRSSADWRVEGGADDRTKESESEEDGGGFGAKSRQKNEAGGAKRSRHCWRFTNESYAAQGMGGVAESSEDKKKIAEEEGEARKRSGDDDDGDNSGHSGRKGADPSTGSKGVADRGRILSLMGRAFDSMFRGGVPSAQKRSAEGAGAHWRPSTTGGSAKAGSSESARGAGRFEVRDLKKAISSGKKRRRRREAIGSGPLGRAKKNGKKRKKVGSSSAHVREVYVDALSRVICRVIKNETAA